MKNAQAYAAEVVRELEYFSPALRGKEINTVYLGGGTPTFMDWRVLEAIFSSIRRCYAQAPGCSMIVEATPDTLDSRKVNVMFRAGVNRINLGVQTLTASVLRGSFRRQTAAGVRAAVKKIRDGGIKTVAVDMIGGLPGETVGSFRNAVEGVISMGSEIIFIYPFNPADSTGWHKLKAADSTQTKNICRAAKSVLLKAGYRNEESAGFSRIDEVLNSQISDRITQNSGVLGVGSTARSHIFGEMAYIQTDPGGIVRAGKDPGVYRGIKMDKDLEMRRFFLGNVFRGFSASQFESIFKASPEKAAPSIIGALKGAIDRHDGLYRYLPGYEDKIKCILYGPRIIRLLKEFHEKGGYKLS